MTPEQRDKPSLPDQSPTLAERSNEYMLGYNAGQASKAEAIDRLTLALAASEAERDKAGREREEIRRSRFEECEALREQAGRLAAALGTICQMEGQEGMTDAQLAKDALGIAAGVLASEALSGSPSPEVHTSLRKAEER